MKYNTTRMTSINKTARLAGLVYLLLIVCGIINLIYIPSQLIVWDNATATFENIMGSEGLFRWGVVSGIITFLAFLVLPLLLYQLLSRVSKVHAQLMVILVLVSIPLSFANILSKLHVLSLIRQPELVQGMGQTVLQTQVMLHLDHYNNGIELSQIFWGLWLLPFGYLVYKSGFLPKLLGILLMAGCFGYLITFFGGFLYPDFYQTTFSTIVGLPASIGEIGTCLWLLIMGTNQLNIKKRLSSASYAK